VTEDLTLSLRLIKNPVFDFKWYALHHEDLFKIIGLDETALTIHWACHGLSEGRASSKDFNVKFYLENDSELKKLHGDKGISDAVIHWLNHGMAEGRKAVPPS